MIHFYNLYYKKSLHGKNNNGCFCLLGQYDRTDMEDDDEKYWMEFDCLTSEIVALVSTEIAAEHHRKYCNKTPKRTSPWKEKKCQTVKRVRQIARAYFKRVDAPVVPRNYETLRKP